MKKTYEPLPMVLNDRYAVLLGKLSGKEKEDTLVRMAVLTYEERHGFPKDELLQQSDRRDPRQVAVRAHLVPVYAYAVDVHDNA